MLTRQPTEILLKIFQRACDCGSANEFDNTPCNEYLKINPYRTSSIRTILAIAGTCKLFRAVIKKLREVRLSPVDFHRPIMPLFPVRSLLLNVIDRHNVVALNIDNRNYELDVDTSWLLALCPNARTVCIGTGWSPTDLDPTLHRATTKLVVSGRRMEHGGIRIITKPHRSRLRQSLKQLLCDKRLTELELNNVATQFHSLFNGRPIVNRLGFFEYEPVRMQYLKHLTLKNTSTIEIPVLLADGACIFIEECNMTGSGTVYTTDRYRCIRVRNCPELLQIDVTPESRGRECSVLEKVEIRNCPQLDSVSVNTYVRAPRLHTMVVQQCRALGSKTVGALAAAVDTFSERKGRMWMRFEGIEFEPDQITAVQEKLLDLDYNASRFRIGL